MQAVLDFPFQAAAQGFAADVEADRRAADVLRGRRLVHRRRLERLPAADVPREPRHGPDRRFVAVANPGAADAELLARDRLAHELMYFSRGNPVDLLRRRAGLHRRRRRPGRAPGHVPEPGPEYNDDDLIGTDATHAQANFDPAHPLYRAIAQARGADAASTRRCATARTSTATPPTAPGVYAFSRIDRREQREYVVALNNAETAQTAAIPTYVGERDVQAHLRRRPRAGCASDRDGRLTRHGAAALGGRLHARRADPAIAAAAPSIALAAPAPAAASRGRMEVRADVGGDSFYEVTFLAKDGPRLDVDRHRRHRAVPRVPRRHRPARRHARAATRRSCSTTAGTRARAVARGAAVPPPALTLDAPRRGLQAARHGRAAAVRRPRARDARRHVRAQRRRRRVDARSARDDSSPAYVASDDSRRSGSRPGTPIALPRDADRAGRRRASTSAERTIAVAPPPLDDRGACTTGGRTGDYANWGLHLWGDAIDPAVLAPDRWDKPWPRDAGRGRLGAVRDPARGRHEAGQLHHAPAGRRHACRTTREPGGDRSFVPIDTPGDLAEARATRRSTRAQPATPGRGSARGAPSASRRWAVSPSTTTWAAAEPSAMPAM